MNWESIKATLEDMKKDRPQWTHEKMGGWLEEHIDDIFTAFDACCFFSSRSSHGRIYLDMSQRRSAHLNAGGVDGKK